MVDPQEPPHLRSSVVLLSYFSIEKGVKSMGLVPPQELPVLAAKPMTR